MTYFNHSRFNEKREKMEPHKVERSYRKTWGARLLILVIWIHSLISKNIKINMTREKENHIKGKVDMERLEEQGYSSYIKWSHYQSFN